MAPRETGFGMPSPTEADLLALAQTGDSDAFGALVEPHLALFFNGILRVLGDRSDAQDALQEGLLGIFKDLPRFEGRSRFSSWAYKICLNAALMFRRRRAQIREESMEAMVGLGSFDDSGHHQESREAWAWGVEADALAEAERRELRTCLLSALDDMSEALRVVFVLKDLEDWSTEAIAAELGQSPAAIRQRLHRARLFAQERLKIHLEGRPQ